MEGSKYEETEDVKGLAEAGEAGHMPNPSVESFFVQIWRVL